MNQSNSRIALLLVVIAACSHNAKAQEDKSSEVKLPATPVTGAEFDLFVRSTPPVEIEHNVEITERNVDLFTHVSDEPDATTEQIPPAEFVGDVKYDVDEFILLTEGQTYRLKTSKDVERALSTDGISVKNSRREVVVKANEIGRTDLHIQFTDKSSVTYGFRVEADSNGFQALIDRLFPDHKLEIVPIRDSVVFIRGTVKTAAEVEQIKGLAEEFWASVHYHIDAIEPPAPTLQLTTRPSSSLIPQGMRLVTIPILEWQRNHGGEKFNRVISLFTTQEKSPATESKPAVYSSEELLIAHNIELFGDPVKHDSNLFLMPLLLTLEQLNQIQEATQKNLQFIAVSQIVNPDSDRSKSDKNDLTPPPKPLPNTSPSRPASGNPVRTDPKSSPQTSRLMTPGPGVAQPQRALQPVPWGGNSSQAMTPPAKANPLSPPTGLPGPPHIPLGAPAGLRPQAQQPPTPEIDYLEVPNGVAAKSYNAVSGLRSDIEALRADVKRLIAILESREEKKKEAQSSNETTSLIPQQGKAVLYFHADWCKVCEKVNPIVKKLQSEGQPVISINVHNQRDIAKQFNINSTPSLVRIYNGFLVPGETKVGAFTRQSLKEFIDSFDDESPTAQSVSFPIKSHFMRSVQVTVSEPALPSGEERTDQTNLGTGTILSKTDESLHVLTAAHLFQKTSENRTVRVKLITNQENTVKSIFLPGMLISQDDDADLAIIEVKLPEKSATNTTLSVLPLAKSGLKVDDIVTFSGFNRNDNSKSAPSQTRWNGKIASINKHQGSENFQIEEVVSTQGMAGATVLNEHQELCGIVIAADHQENETVCTGLNAIQKFIEEASPQLSN